MGTNETPASWLFAIAVFIFLIIFGKAHGETLPCETLKSGTAGLYELVVIAARESGIKPKESCNRYGGCSVTLTIINEHGAVSAQAEPKSICAAGPEDFLTLRRHCSMVDRCMSWDEVFDGRHWNLVPGTVKE